MPTHQFRLLIVDDEPSVCEMLDDLLNSRFSITTAHGIDEARASIQTARPHLVILDVGLAGGNDGLALCRELRSEESTFSIPVLVYTGSNDIDMLTRAFEWGADDFVPKTASVQELIARVLAKVRRHERKLPEPECLRFGNLEMLPTRLETLVDGRKVTLSVLEFNLLRFLVENRERVIKRDEILKGVWPNAVVSIRTIDTHVVSLRKKLAGFDREIGTVYGAGYVLRS